MKDCIFCKIVAQEIEVHKVYEDEHILCFLDIAPVNLGHTLVIPKQHHASLTTVEDEVVARLGIACQKIGRALQRMKQYDGFNIHLNNGRCAGQDVMHSHFHVIPRVGTDKFFWNWRQLAYQSDEQKQEIVRSLQKKLDL